MARGPRLGSEGSLLAHLGRLNICMKIISFIKYFIFLSSLKERNEGSSDLSVITDVCTVLSAILQVF